ncbi:MULTISPECIES: hypothetical protein [Methylomicrobium]|uniref:Uncharacterized protein n=1 Tax=Methylomicrobium album BG8 TaxID=686340 RepID=H8GN95_METAL|nr:MULTISPECIES: hypothetical protein [Methylomicrobium]EIC28324.1 hypothetical protein Metal_0473 [Methylomicrobium album BG8]
MSISLKQKIGFGLPIVILSYMLFDTLLELFLELLDLAFEGIEYVFDAAIEHLFDTSRHTAQVVTFYLLFLIAAASLYRLSRRLPGWYEAFKAEWIDTRHQLGAVTLDYWHTSSASDRMKWGSAFTIGVGMLMWGLLI